MPDFAIEDGLGLPAGARIAGVDEAGRGPLAGPVAAAAVVLDRARAGPEFLARIDDSKRLPAARRRELAAGLRGAAAFGLGWASPEEIDRLDILRATLLAMRRAVAALSERLGGPPDFALVDGNRLPELPCPAAAVVRGDARSLSIAAASILAKTARDAHMAERARLRPGYGWERNAGYGTAEHLAALRRLGPAPEHRRSFAPVRRLLGAEGGGR